MIKNIYMMVAFTQKTRSIGKDGNMIYNLKKDLKYFKETTMGNTIICGKTTYFSFPKRPLEGRKNIILTRSKDTFEGADTLHSKQEVLDYALEHPNEIIFIVGGDSVYKQFINHASKLYITEIEETEEVKADSFFPEVDHNDWNIEKMSDWIEETNSPRYRYLIYNRRKG